MAVIATDDSASKARARPDGYVAWAADGSESEPAVALGLRGALSTWFGLPLAHG